MPSRTSRHGECSAKKAVVTELRWTSTPACSKPSSGYSSLRPMNKPPVPARLGGLFPIRELRPHLRQDQKLCADTAGPVRGQAASTRPSLGLRPALPIAHPARPDLPQWHRRRTQAQPGLAGQSRTPPVKNVGEPCAGERHARFDGRELETEHADHGHRGGTAERETGGTQAPGPTSQPLPPRQLPTQPSSATTAGTPATVRSTHILAS